MTPIPDDQLRKLLLGQLAPADAARLEDAILLEDGVAERLRAEEFDLFDDYVRDRLAPADRADLEQHLLTSPERLLTLRVARALAARPRTARPWQSKRVLFPVVTLLAAGLAAVLVIPHWGTHMRPVPTTTEAAPAAGPTADQTVVLLTDTNRGTAPPVIHLAAGSSTIRLQAEVPGPAANLAYSIRMTDAEGRQVFAGAGLTARVTGPYRFVEVVVPAADLGPGSRRVSLRVTGAAESTPPVFSWQIDTVTDGTARKK